MSRSQVGAIHALCKFSALIVDGFSAFDLFLAEVACVGNLVAALVLQHVLFTSGEAITD